MDIRKAWSEMIAAFTCKGMLIFYFWILVAFSVISGLIRYNLCVFAAFLFSFALIVISIIHGSLIAPFFKFINEWIFQEGERSDSFNRAYKINTYKKAWTDTNEKFSRSDMVIIIILFGIIPLLSSFVVIPNPASEKRKEYTAIGSTVLPIDGRFNLSAPFTKVTRISKNQLVATENLTAKTKDGIPITAKIEANLRLEADKGAILAFAEKREQIQEELNHRLGRAFKEVVGKYTIETLPNDLLILSHLIHQESVSFLLQGIPLVWAGEFTIDKPRIIHE